MTAGTTSPAAVISALTAGLSQSYPAKLQDLVTARYTGQTVTVLNAGKPSEHVYDAATLARFNHEVSDANPNLILLMEGANDLNDAGEAVNDTIATTVGTLEEMVKEAGRRRIPIMVATLPPQRLPKGHGAPYIGRFNDAVKTMAAKKGGILVDVNARVAGFADRAGRTASDGRRLSAHRGNLSRRNEERVRIDPADDFAVALQASFRAPAQNVRRLRESPSTTTPHRAVSSGSIASPCSR